MRMGVQLWRMPRSSFLEPFLLPLHPPLLPLRLPLPPPSRKKMETR